MLDPERLIAYCGIYCGTCARYPGNTAFRDAAALLLELADAHGFIYWMDEHVPFSYQNFRKRLEFFASKISWFYCQDGWKGGSGGPPYCPRTCCEAHNVDICFECADFPCERVKTHFPEAIEGAKRYKELCRQAWLKWKQQEASRGREHHTGKRYHVAIYYE